MYYRATASTAILFLLVVSAVARSDAPPMIVLDLLPAAVSDENATDLENYKANPATARCNVVSFNGATLLDFAGKLEASPTHVNASVVFVRFPVGEPLSFVGTVYEGSEQHGSAGPFLWEGRLEGSSKYFASIVIETSGRVKAYLTSGAGMFRLLPAHGEDRYFLCQRDKSFSSGVSSE